MQAYDNVEIIVLDDASSPPIDAKAMQEIAGAVPVTCLRAEEQLGLNAVRNRLLAAASGDPLHASLPQRG